jgi:hypothetical protein
MIRNDRKTMTSSPSSSKAAKVDLTYKVKISLPSVVALLAIACTGSFILGRDLSAYVHPTSQYALQLPYRESFQERVTMDDHSSRRVRIHEEMLVHPVVLAHLDPKHVAIVSSLPHAILYELLKHKTMQTIYVVDSDSAESSSREQCDSHSQSDVQIEWIESEKLQTMNITLDVVIVDE